MDEKTGAQIKLFAQSHMASKWQNEGSNAGKLVP